MVLTPPHLSDHSLESRRHVNQQLLHCIVVDDEHFHPSIVSIH